MPNDRYLIDDSVVVRPARMLEKGSIIPGFGGRYVVDAGWCAVITESGMYRETLPSGQYPLTRFNYWSDVKSTLVCTQLQTLTLKTVGEFTIARPVPVQVNLDLAIEYRVVDARRVAIEIRSPLTNLYDRAIQAVRGVVAYVTADELRTQGEGIASATLQRLRALQLPTTFGVEIFNVLVTSIRATDTAGDALATQALSEFTTERNAQLDNALTQGTRVTWEWLLRHQPQIAQEMIRTHGMLAKELIDTGALDASGFLNRPVDHTRQVDPTQFFGSLGMPRSFQAGGNPMGSVSGPSALPGPGLTQLPAGPDVHARMREEIDYLTKLPGARVETKPGVDSRGVPDGSYTLRVSMPRSSVGRLTLYLECPPAYPRDRPNLSVDVDEQPTPYQSVLLARWNGQYLVELAREAKQFFG